MLSWTNNPVSLTIAHVFCVQRNQLQMVKLLNETSVCNHITLVKL